MTAEIEPPEGDRTAIRGPKIVCDGMGAKQIMNELGMGEIARKDATVDAVQPITLDHLLKLGSFVEGSGVVPLDHGAILVTRQVMLRQMLRLEQMAGTLKTLRDMKDITQAMGYLGAQIGRISTIGIKTKVEAEVAAEELRKKRQPSWGHGTTVGPVIQAQNGSQVHVHTPNGVATEAIP
jgi:hypothetical protein